MPKLITGCLLIGLLATEGCSSFKVKMPLSDYVSKDPKNYYQETYVSDVGLAKSKIRNRLDYLALLFEQTTDVYQETKKWEQHCFADNRPGTIQEQDSTIFLISELYLDGARTEGHCSDKFYASKGYSIEVYCPLDKKLKRFKFAYPSYIPWEKVDLCR